MPKKIPLRQCLGCRTMHPKSRLIRVVKNAQGEINLDHTSKMPGRGAYLCLQAPCLKRAQKSRALERAFSSAISPEIYQGLEESLKYAIKDSPNLIEQEVKENVTIE